MPNLTRRAAMASMGVALIPSARAASKRPLKEHKEFHAVDFGEGWQPVPGYPAGIDEKILSGHLDETGKKGSLTRLLRFKPGAFTTLATTHTYWEEVYVLSGDFIVGSDKDGNGGERFLPNTYACRPPGIRHGPFKSEAGCVLLEIHYFDRL